MQWLYFSLMTVFAWGLYGVFLHGGQLAMKDPDFGRYKAFLFVGIAYLFAAVLAPLVLLKLQGSGSLRLMILRRGRSNDFSWRAARC